MIKYDEDGERVEEQGHKDIDAIDRFCHGNCG
jgi:hypothetical protein